MTQCFYCKKGNVITPPGAKSFEEFVDTTYVECKLGNKTGCDYCPAFEEDEAAKTE